MKKTILFLSVLLFLPILAVAQELGTIPADITFGLDPTYLALATAFVLLHVAAVRGLVPSIDTKPMARLLAVVFAALYLAVVQWPGFGEIYLKIALPLIGPAGVWKATSSLIKKAKR